MASLVLGVIWAAWHGPLWLIPDLPYGAMSYPLYALQVVAMSVVYTWLFNSTGGSVLLAMVLHAATNTASAYLADGLTAQIAVTVVWWLLAATVVVRHGPRHLAPRRRVDALSTIERRRS